MRVSMRKKEVKDRGEVGPKEGKGEGRIDGLKEEMSRIK